MPFPGWKVSNVVKHLVALLEEYCHLGGSALYSLLQVWAFSSGISLGSGNPCSWVHVLLPSLLPWLRHSHAHCAGTEVADNI